MWTPHAGTTRISDQCAATQLRAIKEDVEWLGFEWAGKVRFASDYFDRLYEFGVQLIQKGKSRDGCFNDQLINADFYLSASGSEGMSNSLMESMALGVPAIASNVSGVVDMVADNQNGFIFEPRDEKIFYDKIIKAINCSEENYIEMSRSASQHIFKNFSIEPISKEHIKLYTSLVNNF